jgi:hypothetical protein
MGCLLLAYLLASKIRIGRQILIAKVYMLNIPYASIRDLNFGGAIVGGVMQSHNPTLGRVGANALIPKGIGTEVQQCCGFFPFEN